MQLDESAELARKGGLKRVATMPTIVENAPTLVCPRPQRGLKKSPSFADATAASLALGSGFVSTSPDTIAAAAASVSPRPPSPVVTGRARRSLFSVASHRSLVDLEYEEEQEIRKRSIYRFQENQSFENLHSLSRISSAQDLQDNYFHLLSRYEGLTDSDTEDWSDSQV
mmetsp:Transcript_25776/g.50781  ORF Transcript_25776/g.50781 Transcript_25776/m.50781 type:complete len:169 (-) Transcript_25776:207-713(-)